jgi:hypothetical protein
MVNGFSLGDYLSINHLSGFHQWQFFLKPLLEFDQRNIFKPINEEI